MKIIYDSTALILQERDSFLMILRDTAFRIPEDSKNFVADILNQPWDIEAVHQLIATLAIEAKLLLNKEFKK